MFIDRSTRQCTMDQIKESTIISYSIQLENFWMDTMIFFILLIPRIYGISIPFIDNVFLHPLPNADPNVIVRLNSSCAECLCERFNSTNNISNLALNCFSNRTCQFFPSFPVTYKVKSSVGSRLYFLQNQFPDPSQCCMPNITELLMRFKSITPIVMNLSFPPAALGYDEANPSEAAVTSWGHPILYFFDPMTMTYLRNFTISTSYFLTLYNNLTFTASGGIPSIYIRDSKTNNLVGNITYSSLGQVRKMIFLNNATTAVISTQTNNSLTCFDVNSPTNYTFQRFIPLPFVNAHGIAKVNDTLLYGSSWGPRSIASIKLENSTWIVNPFASFNPPGSGSFISTDDCGRVWFVSIGFGLHIYDSSGVYLDSWNMTTSSTDGKYDLLLLSNYVLFVTHYDAKKIIRYDPQITCS